MSDLISRQEIRYAVESLGEDYISKIKMLMLINQIPSAEPERKTGKWTHDGSQWENRWICSECGYKWFFRKEEAHFCPNCGAEMRGDR